MGMLDGKVALVTGGSGGIGKGLCKALAEAGADVVVHYRSDAAGAAKAAALVAAAGRQCETLQADTSRAAEARALVEQAVARFGHLDILINNAATFPRSLALDMTEELWDQVIDTNLKGTFICSQAAAGPMKKAGWGRIVNIGSVSMFGQARGAHYSAAKAGLLGLTRTLAIEWAPEITVNCVAPGLVDTPQPRYGMTEEQIAARAASLLIPRIGQPEDVANAVLFYVSPATSWVTGQVMHVNGGDPRA
jgi:NAD(P)-dependent dehydrogenase (short-subunit alcohol dehydrogenase family)